MKELKSYESRLTRAAGKSDRKKKSGPKAVAVLDPITEELKTSRKEILDTTILYCKNLLTNNKPDVEYEKDIKIKNILHDARMKEYNEEDDTFEDNDFLEAICRFKAKGKSCYDFLTKAGDDFQEAVKILLKRIWDYEIIPKECEYTLLIMLYKGKGLKECLDNNRFIHSKIWLPRLFEDIVAYKMKPKVQTKTTNYQIGGMKGHRSAEHLFSVKSVIAYYMWIGIAIIIQCLDIRKYFDKENLRDALNALYTAGVKGKAYRLWYKLNLNTRIAVQTGAGLTEECDTGETLGQGTVGGALASALNIDEEVNAHFETSQAEICYGSVRFQPVSFQDDILRMSVGRNEAQEGCNRFEAVFKSKLLEIHPTKSCFLVFSPNKKIGESMGQEVMERPLVYDNFEIKRKSEEKWLGDILCERGLAESAEATITSRYGKILTSIFELKSVMEDLRMQIIGGLKCGLDIWELAMVPSLMNNCGTWMNISEKSIEKLDQLQNIFLQCMFSVSQSVPKPALCWDTATLTMQVRVDKAKLSLLHHIKHLENTSLAKQVYIEQHERGWPGLVAECKDITKQWQIPDITESGNELSKCEWKSILKSGAKTQNCKILQERICKSSKL